MDCLRVKCDLIYLYFKINTLFNNNNNNNNNNKIIIFYFALIFIIFKSHQVSPGLYLFDGKSSNIAAILLEFKINVLYFNIL